MRRREFIVLLGAAAWPLSARAQRTGRLLTIGFLGSATPAVWAPWTAAFENRLYELGWMKGRTVAIEYRWAEGRSERFTEIATEFVRFNVDAIVTAGTDKPWTSSPPVKTRWCTRSISYRPPTRKSLPPTGKSLRKSQRLLRRLHPLSPLRTSPRPERRRRQGHQHHGPTHKQFLQMRTCLLEG
jgi:hypothetical protein